MKLTEVLIACTLLGVSNAHAQLNGSRLELTQRFGQPRSEKKDQLFGSQECLFHRDGWVIEAWLLNGSCHSISYMKSGVARPGSEEIAALLDQNADGQSWLLVGQMMTAVTVSAKPFKQVHFPRRDHGAYLVKFNNGVVFKTAHWKQLEERTRVADSEPPAWLETEKGPQPHFQSWLPTAEILLKPKPKPIPAPDNTPLRFLGGDVQTRFLGDHSPVVGGVLLLAFVLIRALILGKVWRSPSVKGWIGEKVTYLLILKRLDPAVYRIFNDVYLPRPDGKDFTQIDHVVVSSFGIFVIETKNMAGWIFGRSEIPAGLKSSRVEVPNSRIPCHQNRLHVKALMACLGLPERVFHSVVFFAGKSTFKTPMPENVLDVRLQGFIEKRATVMLQGAQVDEVVARLAEAANRAKGWEVRRNHVRNLKRLHNERFEKAA